MDFQDNDKGILSSSNNCKMQCLSISQNIFRSFVKVPNIKRGVNTWGYHYYYYYYTSSGSIDSFLKRNTTVAFNWKTKMWTLVELTLSLKNGPLPQFFWILKFRAVFCIPYDVILHAKIQNPEELWHKTIF